MKWSVILICALAAPVGAQCVDGVCPLPAQTYTAPTQIRHVSHTQYGGEEPTAEPSHASHGSHGSYGGSHGLLPRLRAWIAERRAARYHGSAGGGHWGSHGGHSHGSYGG